MNLVAYWNEKKWCEKRLFKAIKDVVPSDSLYLHHGIEDLSQGIRQVPWGASIAVLLTSSTKELSEIIALKGLFLESRNHSHPSGPKEGEHRKGAHSFPEISELCRQ